MDKQEKTLAVFTGIIYHRIRTCNWRIAWETTGEHGEEVIDRLGAFWHVQAVFSFIEYGVLWIEYGVLWMKKFCGSFGHQILQRMDENTPLVFVERKQNIFGM